MTDLTEHFALAERGKKLWESLDKRLCGEHYIFFPHTDNEYNLYALIYIDKFLDSKGINKAVIVTADPAVSKSAGLFSSHDLFVEEMSEEDIKSILKYYGLFEFTSRLTIISLTIPYDTRGENFLGIKEITKKDLVCYDIYRFGCVPTARIPSYEGDDPDIKKLFAMAENR